MPRNSSKACLKCWYFTLEFRSNCTRVNPKWHCSHYDHVMLTLWSRYASISYALHLSQLTGPYSIIIASMESEPAKFGFAAPWRAPLTALLRRPLSPFPIWVVFWVQAHSRGTLTRGPHEEQWAQRALQRYCLLHRLVNKLRKYKCIQLIIVGKWTLLQ